jgi:CheY-like chemotaxis protein
VTARAMEEDRLQCVAAGMNDYLAKPISRALVDEMLRKWLKSKHKQ